MMERLLRSFRDAFAGLAYCFATQRNMAIHAAAGAAVLVLAFLLHLERWEFFLILSAVFAVLIAETINTAIEKAVDLATKEQHRLAHIAKDVAAGGGFADHFLCRPGRRAHFGAAALGSPAIIKHY